jgi:hypothetical protein
MKCFFFNFFPLPTFFKNGKIYNLAAQSFNHEFYWASLDPEKKALDTTSSLSGAIIRDFSNIFSQLVFHFKKKTLVPQSPSHSVIIDTILTGFENCSKNIFF